MLPKIVVDTREQQPYIIEPKLVVNTALSIGDYSIVGHELEYAIERKSLTDMFNTYKKSCVPPTSGHFIRNLKHMMTMKGCAVVIECTRKDFLKGPKHYRGREPVADYASRVRSTIDGWWVTYHVPFFFMSRDEAYEFVVATLMRWRRLV